MFSAIQFQNGQLKLLDQRLLPAQEIWLDYTTLEEVAVAIEDMVVRGAPAIACAGAYGLVLDANLSKASHWSGYASDFAKALDRMARTRPTAVNLFHMITNMRKVVAGFSDTMSMVEARARIAEEADNLFQSDLATCKAIGEFGLGIMAGSNLAVMTHCNTGSLATAGFGTALGVIRSFHQAGRLRHVYVDETRPFMQGSRLTAFELMQEKIPFSVQVDGAAAFLMAREKVDFVVVGADRIAANGDTANKIGTYSLAIAAKHHGIPFYVAAPLTTFDPAIKSGADIPVEDRDPKEITHWAEKPVTPLGSRVKNPSFDVTPGELIAGIITEKGILRSPYTESIGKLF